jgi:hypothetical protein
VRNQGSEVSGQSVEQSRGDAAKGCLEMKGVRDDKPQETTPLSAQPVDFKREGGRLVCQGPFVETPNGREAGLPHPPGRGDRSAIDAAALANTMA